MRLGQRAACRGPARARWGIPRSHSVHLCLLLKAEPPPRASVWPRSWPSTKLGHSWPALLPTALQQGQGLPRATLTSFLSLHRPVLELRGLPESTGIHTLSHHQDFRLLRWVLAEGWPGQPECLLSSPPWHVHPKGNE